MLQNLCSVCSAPSASYHFGAIVCRACAAFFRRFVHNRKKSLHCDCFLKKIRSYPCRSCRMEKCMAVGMQISEIQNSREPIKRMSIENAITPRTQDTISIISKNYKNLESTRDQIHNRVQNSAKHVELNLHDFSREVMMDIKLAWKFCEKTFPEFNSCSTADKKTLFYNVHTKWNILELAMQSSRFNDCRRFWSPSGATTTSVEKYYVSNLKGDLSEQEIAQVFGPLWDFHRENVIGPLMRMKFGDVENMALLGLLFWDPGYTNIGDELVKICHSMRKIILRELKSYYSCDEQVEDREDHRRFFETLDAINLIEKSEQVSRREIELCGLYNIEIAQERRNMILWDKY